MLDSARCSVLLAVVTPERRRICELEAENAELRGAVEELQAAAENLTAELHARKALLGSPVGTTL